jgi:hypothetical protein
MWRRPRRCQCTVRARTSSFAQATASSVSIQRDQRSQSGQSPELSRFGRGRKGKVQITVKQTSRAQPLSLLSFPSCLAKVTPLPLPTRTLPSPILVLEVRLSPPRPGGRISVINEITVLLAARLHHAPVPGPVPGTQPFCCNPHTPDLAPAPHVPKPFTITAPQKPRDL